MSAMPLLEVELYVFEGASFSVRLTPHEFDVDIDGQRYERCPIERSTLALGAEAAKSALELRLPPDHALVRHLLQAAITGEATAVRLIVARIHTSGIAQAVRWMGRVLGVEVSSDAARIRCESAQVSLKRIGLRRLYSRACSHVLYSAACGASPITASAVVGWTDGSLIFIEGGVPPSVLGMLAGGWMQMPDGARHMIVRDDPDAVELLYPVAIASGTEIVLVAGCDHSTTTCQARFDNLANYGGFPAIPSKNPFATGVF
ncbi:phage BR0599 family protein [Caldimonas manganoxidans]|uniref:phage BR0599 family protein n=1 Tax=Caldimonas manganoxidans TaxID=196015 RepID=UPI000477D65C|nr:phage BR0599 family protein [Caldimonas manganoxidans]